MRRTEIGLLISVLALAGCGGSGGGSGGPNEALFGGPLMFMNAQHRLYGARDLQFVDFNNDGLPDIYHNSFLDSQFDYSSLVVALGSESELFRDEYRLLAGMGSALADFDGDGALDIFYQTINGPDDRGFLFGPSVLWGNGDGTFADPDPLGPEDTGMFDTSLVGDFNGDSLPDVFSFDGYDASVLLNLGNGDFEELGMFSLVSFADSAAVADLNGDLFDDVVLFRDDDSATARFLRSVGDGTFADPLPVLTAEVQFWYGLDDFNGDGNADLLGISPAGIFVYLGVGDGTFGDPVMTPLSLFDGDYDPFTVADLNEDSIPDFVFAIANDGSTGANSSVYVTLGNGDGSFGEITRLGRIGEQIDHTGAHAVDVDGDGNLDIVSVAWYGVPFLRPFFGNGDGTFRDESSELLDIDLAAGLIRETDAYGSPSTRSFDIDEDGNLDLLVRNGFAAGDMSLFLGRGDGTFENEQRLPLGDDGRIQFTSDLDADGDVDFFGQGIPFFLTILRNYGEADLRPLPKIPVTVTLFPQIGIEAVRDLDLDGLPDLLFDFDNGDIGVLYGLGDMQFEALVTVANIGDERFRAVEDITGDGYPDIVSTIFFDGPDSLVVRPGGADRTFGAPVSTELTGPENIVTEIFEYNDVTGDGRTDIVRMLATFDNNTTIISLLQGEPDGSLMTVQELYVPWSATGSALVDLDSDGDHDLVVAVETLADFAFLDRARRLNIHGFLRNSAGRFDPVGGVQALIRDSDSGEYDVNITDITGDGIPDALVYSQGLGLAVAIGQGDGTFGRPHYFLTRGGSEPVFGDFDNDGDADFAAPIAPGGLIELLENRLVQE